MTNRPDIDAIRDGYRSFGGDPFVEELCDYIEQLEAELNER